MKIVKSLALAAMSASVLAGCTGTPMKTQNLEPGQYEVIGKGSGTATGIHLFGVIPIGLNDRFPRAQQLAIDSKHGDALINVQVQEDWYWAYVLNGYKTTVSGDVVKLKNK